MEGLEGTTIIESHTTDPTEIHLSFPKNILTNSETLATLQLLDSAKNPVYAKKDIEINLVSNDEQILKIPEKVIIKKGDYFTTFNTKTNSEGEIELALLSEDFALSKYDINVVDISPVLTLNLPSTMNWNERIEAKLTVSIPEIEIGLDGFGVEWIVDGGETRSMESTTNNEGVAILNIIPNEKDTVSITANISGNSLGKVSVSKTVTILNVPVDDDEITDNADNQTQGMPIGINVEDYVSILPITIPVAVIGALVYLKRTDRLDSITEKIPIMDKVEEIKEKISDIRDR